jgi:CRISPR-associated protein Cas2
MRRVYIVSYDICDPKRLRKIYEKMLGFGDRIQLSVFRCELTDKERVILESVLSEIMNHREDRVMIADLGPVHSQAGKLKFIGKPVEQSERAVVIV